MVQAHVPALQVPPGQSASLVHTNGWHLPPQVPLPQSALVVQAFWLQTEPVHLPPVPHSDAVPHDAGVVHLAPVHTASGH